MVMIRWLIGTTVAMDPFGCWGGSTEVPHVGSFFRNGRCFAWLIRPLGCSGIGGCVVKGAW